MRSPSGPTVINFVSTLTPASRAVVARVLSRFFSRLLQCFLIFSERKLCRERRSDLARHVGWWCAINYMNESKHRILIFCQPYGFSQRKVRGIAPVNRHQNAPIHSHLPVETRLLLGPNNSSYKRCFSLLRLF